MGNPMKIHDLGGIPISGNLHFLLHLIGITWVTPACVGGAALVPAPRLSCQGRSRDTSLTQKVVFPAFEGVSPESSQCRAQAPHKSKKQETN